MLKLTISDITEFLNKVSVEWDKINTKGRKLASKYAPMVTNYTDVIIEGDYKTIADFLVQRFHIYMIRLRRNLETKESSMNGFLLKCVM